MLGRGKKTGDRTGLPEPGACAGESSAGSHWIVTLGFIYRLSQVGQEGPGSFISGPHLGAKKDTGRLTQEVTQREGFNEHICVISIWGPMGPVGQWQC